MSEELDSHWVDNLINRVGIVGPPAEVNFPAKDEDE